MEATILVADNEPDILRFVEVNLRLDGYEVVTVTDGQAALDTAFDIRPALVLLDVMMPKVDGFEVCRRLRSDPRTSATPVIILTAKSLTVDKVVGLTAGADDYVLKPFDPTELVARVRSALGRAQEYRGSSPLTGLPGNHRIDAEVARRLGTGEPTAVIYADLNGFKPFNDHYNFLRGDELIRMTADVLREALWRHGGTDTFLGHIGGDDFVLVCDPERVDAVCRQAIREFDRRVSSYYDPEDLERGWIEVENRKGERERYGMVSIALGVGTNARRSFDDHRALVQVATEMKVFLKRTRNGSAYAVDERSTEDTPAGAPEPAR